MGFPNPYQIPQEKPSALQETVDWANRNGFLTSGGQPRGRVSEAVAAVIAESMRRINAEWAAKMPQSDASAGTVDG